MPSTYASQRSEFKRFVSPAQKNSTYGFIVTAAPAP